MSNEIGDLKKEIHKRDFQIRKLEKLVFEDSLTGLYNRRGFLELAGKFINDINFLTKQSHKRQHFFVDSLAILFFDIDNFKKINDTFGHEIGDKILRFVAAIIIQKLRSSDLVARFGGEEIVAALVGANANDAFKKAEEIRKAIKSRVKIPRSPSQKITVSIGVAESDGKLSLEAIIKNADSAMYKAKTTGKDKTVTFSGARK